MTIKHGMGPEHPLNDRLQLIMITLFFAAWIMDSLSLFPFGYSSVMFDVLSFPILILPAALLFIVGRYLIVKSHSEVLVENPKNAKFIDSGVYSSVRHPMYLGGLLLLLSFLFISASLVALGVWIVFFIILNNMAAYEEKELVRLLGKKYVNYQSKVHKWLPIMKRKQFMAILVGVIVALLGLLWFLQGAGIIQMCPVLCVMDCKCITGGSPFWEAAGAIVFIIGIVIIGLSVRRVGKP